MRRPRARNGTRCVFVAGSMLVGIASGCGSEQASPAAVESSATTTSSTEAASTTTTTPSPTTTIAPTTTHPSTTSLPATTSTTSPTTTTAPGPIEFVDARFLGIAQASLLTEVADIFGVTAEPYADAVFPADFLACPQTDSPWVIQVGGLTMVFEDLEGVEETARLTNWSYYGGPVGGYTEMVAPLGITVGSTRQEIFAAYPEPQEMGRDVFVYQPVNMRFAMSGDTVAWFGIVDCVFEPQLEE